MDGFQDRVAVITGGASGIGRAMATRFAAAGMRVAPADIEEPALHRAVDELRAAGAQAIGVRADVAVAEDVTAVRDATLERFGAVHVVCNNAGMGAGGIVGAPEEVWEWVIGVNLWELIHDGHIVNTASLAGLGGVAGLGIHCTTKFAVVGLSESLHAELAQSGSGVGVSVLCPGFVQTDIATAARNAPASLDDWVEGSDTTGTRDVAAALTAAGIPAPDVAEAVFDALQTRRFFVLPHARAAIATTQARLEWMRGGGPPDIDPSHAFQP